MVFGIVTSKRKLALDEVVIAVVASREESPWLVGLLCLTVDGFHHVLMQPACLMLSRHYCCAL